MQCFVVERYVDVFISFINLKSYNNNNNNNNNIELKQILTHSLPSLSFSI